MYIQQSFVVDLLVPIKTFLSFFESCQCFSKKDVSGFQYSVLDSIKMRKRRSFEKTVKVSTANLILQTQIEKI